MSRPRLLLIDDEPALANYVASAATGCGYQPIIARSEPEFRAEFVEARPDMVTLDLGMPEADGVQYLRFLSDQQFKGPVLIISGFDRRVLESAFRLGEALGLRMVGPLEKPTRLEDLEELLGSMKPSLAGS